MEQLLKEIEEFLAETGMAPSYFGLVAARDSGLVARLSTPGKRGRPGRVWPEKEAEIRKYMADRRAQQNETDRASTSEQAA